jgi:hypothetical protein
MMLRQIVTDTSRTDTEPLVVTFGIDEFWRRVDSTGRSIGDEDSLPDEPAASMAEPGGGN